MDHFTNWVGDRYVDLSVALGTVAVLVVAPFGILLLKRLVRRGLRHAQRRIDIGYDTALLITRLITGAAWFTIALLLLHIWGIDVGGLWTILVSAATLIGVGFLATWTMISNFTANLFVTVWRPFQLGETVEILPENLKGKVVDRNMMYTILREENGGLLRIPNNFFFQKMFRVTGGDEKFWFEDLHQTVGSHGHDDFETAEARRQEARGSG